MDIGASPSWYHVMNPQSSRHSIFDMQESAATNRDNVSLIIMVSSPSSSSSCAMSNVTEKGRTTATTMIMADCHLRRDTEQETTSSRLREIMIIEVLGKEVRN